MAFTTIDELYEQAVRPLSLTDQLRLVERIARDLSDASSGEPEQRYDWMSLRGIAPGLLEGEDAQAWVSRCRQEADRHREPARGTRK